MSKTNSNKTLLWLAKKLKNKWRVIKEKKFKEFSPILCRRRHFIGKRLCDDTLTYRCKRIQVELWCIKRKWNNDKVERWCLSKDEVGVWILGAILVLFSLKFNHLMEKSKFDSLEKFVSKVIIIVLRIHVLIIMISKNNWDYEWKIISLMNLIK